MPENNTVKILGISAFYHDSAAALIINGEIIAAAQEERFTRIKHDSSFPKNAVLYCLKESGLEIHNLDAIVFYDKPFLKFERLLETYFSFAPKGLLSFAKSIPVWAKEKLFFKQMIKDELKELGNVDYKKTPLKFAEHHLSHAASSFYPSPFNEAAVVTIDGVGEWATASIGYGNGKEFEILKEMHFPHSVGLLYSAFTYFLGFKVNSGEYKLMGLAPYGQPNSSQTQEFEKTIRENLITIHKDGSIFMNQKYFNYATGLTMVQAGLWEKLFGFKIRKAEDSVLQHHCNLALAIQRVTEEIVLKICAEAALITKSKNLCLAGGVALNCVANGKLKAENIFGNIFIQPAAGDAGGALGAALSYYYCLPETIRKIELPDSMKASLLGPEIEDADIKKLIQSKAAVAQLAVDENDLCKKIAEEIANGKVIGWCRGRMEWGPRALGNRSILGDPSNQNMQKTMNLKVKFRESFRPFAPIVAENEVSDYFEYEGCSPYMLMVAPVKNEIRNSLPENYQHMEMNEKLYCNRSKLQAITHVDFSARLQTVSTTSNPVLFKLLQEFKKIKGFAVLINTSFNVRSEPIVCNAEDAYRCFMRTDMDILVLNNHVFYKIDQPAWIETEDWKSKFIPD